MNVSFTSYDYLTKRCFLCVKDQNSQDCILWWISPRLITLYIVDFFKINNFIHCGFMFRKLPKNIKLWLKKIINDFVYCWKYDYKNILTGYIRQKIKNLTNKQQNMSRLHKILYEFKITFSCCFKWWNFFILELTHVLYKIKFTYKVNNGWKKSNSKIYQDLSS